MPGEQKGGAHIGVHEAVVFFRVGFNEVLVVASTCIVDQDIQPSEGIERDLNRLDGRLLFAGVAGDGDRLVPSDSASFFKASSRSWRRAVRTSRAPSPAKARAHACPIPALAPVMSATFPSSFFVMSFAFVIVV